METSRMGQEEQAGARARPLDDPRHDPSYFLFEIGWACAQAWVARPAGDEGWERGSDGFILSFDRPESARGYAERQGWSLEVQPGAGACPGLDMGAVEVWASQPTVLPMDPSAVLETWNLLAAIARGGLPAVSRFLAARPFMEELYLKLYLASDPESSEADPDSAGDAIGSSVAQWSPAELRKIAKHLTRGFKESREAFGFEF